MAKDDRKRDDFDTRGDFGPPNRWASFGNRADYRHEEESDFTGARSGVNAGGGPGPFSGGLGAYGERGPHTGKGPKNWRRPDDRIREDVNDRLTDHPHIDASEIEVTVNQCEVTLTGTVEDRHAKRLAEDIAHSVSGVRDVHNQIRVGTQTPNR